MNPSRDFILLCWLLLLAPLPAFANASTLTARIVAANSPYDENRIEAVQPLSEPTVWAQETFQGRKFKVLARKGLIERYPCHGCHNPEKKVLVNDGPLLSHGEIRMRHGQGQNNLTCDQCHHNQDRDALVDKQGKKIDLDHGYQLCGQCHFRQKRDWLGGAHGKRVGYWSGGRTIRNCTTCHNPHAPKFKKRMPATYSLPLTN